MDKLRNNSDVIVKNPEYYTKGIRGPYEPIARKKPISWANPARHNGRVAFYEQHYDSQWDWLAKMRKTAI